MESIYLTLFFIYGLVFGSFFNVVGSRIPRKESIVLPSSHCEKCGHKLTFLELLPVLSYFFQKGKCKKCKTKLSIMYPLFELFTGLVFALAYLKFGLTVEIIIPLTFMSMLLIIIVSDIEYMIIPDEILIFFGILLIIEIFIIEGWLEVVHALLGGTLAFLSMMALKIFGDHIFAKESMGGGDVKLLFFLGLCMELKNALFSIFVGAILGLPISLLILHVKKTNIIPFGPFLSLAAIIIVLSGFGLNELLVYLI